MKKYTINSKKVLYLSVLCCLWVTSCKTQINSNNDIEHNLSDITNLFIINPTNKNKNVYETWFSLKTSTRTIIDDSIKNSEKNNYNDYIEHTVPFLTSKIEQKSSHKERAVKNDIPFMTYSVGDIHLFSDNNSHYIGNSRVAEMKYEGNYCYIWTFTDEKEESKMSPEEIKTFAQKFDEIFIKETVLCGEHYKGDSVYSGIIIPNEKISIVLYDIGNDKRSGNIYGYFQPSYYYSTQNGNNNIEVIFIDSYYAKQKEVTPALLSALVHEFNHLLNYVNKTLKYGLEMKSWYTEMLSMITEDFFLDDLKVDYRNSPHARLEKFISGGHKYGFGNWEDITTSSITPFNYSNAYAFGAYLARNYGGAKLIHEIATNEYVNEKSIVEAVNKINGSNYSFNDLLKEFPYILINTENTVQNFPSLNINSYESIFSDNRQFDFSLNSINLNSLNPNISIQSDDINSASITHFDSYGFLFYNFYEKRDVKISLKDFLLYSAY